jgi:hypothetical protein
VEGAFSLVLRLDPEYDHWAKPWSVAELAEALDSLIVESNISNLRYFQEEAEFISAGFGIELLIDDPNSVMDNKLESALEILRSLTEETNHRLSEDIRADTLSIFFDFPPSIRTPCKQYLVYFAQFLADIGIEANTELKQKSNQTLFTVSPKSGEDALSKIKEALAVYLNAPANPAFEVQTLSHNDLAVKQWEANVYHLKSQLLLANATLQAKDATLKHLSFRTFNTASYLQGRKRRRRARIY